MPVAPTAKVAVLQMRARRACINDYRLDVSEGFQLFTTLQRLKVPSKMLYFPDEGHWVLKPQNSRLWYKTVNDWVDQWFKDTCHLERSREISASSSPCSS